LEFNVPFQHKYGYIRDETRQVKLGESTGYERTTNYTAVARAESIHVVRAHSIDIYILMNRIKATDHRTFDLPAQRVQRHETGNCRGSTAAV